MVDNSSKKIFSHLTVVIAGLFLFVVQAGATSLSISPTTGTFTIGSTIEVPIYLNTQGQSINAVAVFLKFPPDKLQLVSPSTGRSIIDIWPALPRFNNLSGEVELQGLVPGGINTSGGLITTLTFRVKSVGQATVKLLDESKVLLNDGLGTDSLTHLISGIYQLVLPPPAGPIVTSSTHPDSTKWVANSTLGLNWVAADEAVEGYSYVLDTAPTTLPDDISEGSRTDVTYKNLADGIHYFHIKALRRGSWGGVTHFSASIDTTPPAEFPIDIIPSARTTRRQPSAQWTTTDNLSGVDYYELKSIPLTPRIVEAINNDSARSLFIEVQSPYTLPTLERGRYDVIIRAYDHAGNFQEMVEGLTIVNPLFKLIGGQGLEIGGAVTLSWAWVWLFFFIAILFLWQAVLKVRNWHRSLDERRTKKVLPDEVKQQLEELRHYQTKYGKVILLVISFSLLGLMFGRSVEAIEKIVPPPLITTVSRAITNQDIFYIGGKTDVGETPVLIYFQNLATGETTSFETVSDKDGEWFYRHNTFLTSGRYQLWAQSRIGEEWSPPSPQFNMNVQPTALQFGTSRLSYSVIFLIIILILSGTVIILLIYAVVYRYRGRKKHELLIREVHEAEESVRRGFAILRRDITTELALIKKAKLDRELAEEEKQTEEHLLKDLSAVERYIGREIWEVEQAEG